MISQGYISEGLCKWIRHVKVVLHYVIVDLTLLYQSNYVLFALIKYILGIRDIVWVGVNAFDFIILYISEQIVEQIRIIPFLSLVMEYAKGLWALCK